MDLPIDNDHALSIGFLAGALLREGVKIEAVYDDDGNYTDELILILQERMFRVKVLPGSMDVWTKPAPDRKV